MKVKANEIIAKINRWNAIVSQSHDEYLGEITRIVFGDTYDCALESNFISDYEKLSRIWKFVNNNTYSSRELINKTKEIILM